MLFQLSLVCEKKNWWCIGLSRILHSNFKQFEFLAVTTQSPFKVTTSMMSSRTSKSELKTELFKSIFQVGCRYHPLFYTVKNQQSSHSQMQICMKPAATGCMFKNQCQLYPNVKVINSSGYLLRNQKNEVRIVRFLLLSH